VKKIWSRSEISRLMKLLFFCDTHCETFENVDLVKRWKINGSLDPLKHDHGCIFSFSEFEKHVELHPNAAILIQGEVGTTGNNYSSHSAWIELDLTSGEDDSSDLRRHVKISLLFGIYKKDSHEILACGTIVKDHDDCWNDAKGVRLTTSMTYCNPEDCRYQIQLVIKIPEKKTSSTMVQDVQKLFCNSDFSDVTVVCGAEEEKFECHKAILAVRSKVFCAMFNTGESSENQTGVVTVDDINAKTMKSLLKYIYQDQVKVEDVDADLLLAADKYDLQGLFSQCKGKIVYNLSNDNIFDILMASRMLYLNDINELAMKWIRRHANDIQGGDQWNKLKRENPDLAKEVARKWILEAALPKKPPPVKKDKIGSLRKQIEAYYDF
jgi:speckle-type POZ protein